MFEKSQTKNYLRKADNKIVKAFLFDPVFVFRTKLPEMIEGCPSANADNWAYEGCIFWLASNDKQRVVNGHMVITEEDKHSVMPMNQFDQEFEECL